LELHLKQGIKEERAVRIHRLKWTLPILVWVLLTILMPFGLVPAYGYITIAIFSYYLGAWSSEFLINLLAKQYLEAMVNNNEVPEAVKKDLATLRAVGVVGERRKNV